MNYHIITLPALTVVGKKIRTTNKNWKCMTDINNLWSTIHTNNIFAQIPNPAQPFTILSVYTDYPADFNVFEDDYSVLIGALITKVENIPSDLIIKEIPETKYAVFTAQGPFDTAIGATWQEIWNSDIQRAFTSDFELYDAASTNDENSIVKIYMAIK